MIARESAAVPPENADVAVYLRQHDIVYQQPSSNWVEGLPLGNGDVGALVAGVQGREQTFYLDKTDIWHTAPDGTALGRSWAGTVRIRYRGGGEAESFRQRLSLGSAEVETADGAFRSIARVDALRNRLEVESEAAGAQIELERQPVTLWVNRRGGYQNAERLFGSWANVMPAGQLEKLRFRPPGDGKTLWEAPNNAHPYRCHPVVFFPLYPTNAISYGSPLFESARRTVPVVTRLLGFRYEDRHAAIPEFEGGIEPNGFSSGILTVNAARLGDRDLYRRFLYGLIMRFHLKQNGLRALIDTCHSDAISRASLVEAANAHPTAISESLLQSWGDHIRLLPCIPNQGRVRFGGLRAAGGFVISAEAIDGKLRWARVTSLRGGPLRIALSKDAPVTTLETRAGGVYLLPAGARRPDLHLPDVPPRSEPRTIPLAEIERAASGLLHYPEDLPYGQVVRDDNLYLGIPTRYGAPAALPPMQLLLNQSKSVKWEERQQAARRLASLGARPEVLAALDRLCADPMNVVAYTAAVSLVHIGGQEALSLADKHSKINVISGLRREVEKARRLRR